MDDLLYGSGLQHALRYFRSGGRGGIELLNELRRSFPGFSQRQYADAAVYARENRDAARTASALDPGDRINPNIVPSHPHLGLDATRGERFKVAIDVTFQPMTDGPELVRRTYWAGTRAPTGYDLAAAALQYVVDQMDVWGTTPGSRDVDEDDKLDPLEAFQGFTIGQINQI